MLQRRHGRPDPTEENGVHTLAKTADPSALMVRASVYTPVSDRELTRERAEAPPAAQWSIHATERVDATLARAKKRALERELQTETVARRGEPADVICELAAEHEADLLVIGNKGMNRRGLPRSYPREGVEAPRGR
jgi:nucleotide-binding universal stress UspA family protein